MQVKISKTLEGIIARAAFNTTKAGIDHSLKDFLMLEMLREEGSLAYQLLSSRLKDWELYQVRLRIEREVLGAGRRENTGAEEFYRAFTDELCAVSGATRSVSTAHALRAIVGDRSTATSRVLEMYGITGEVVSEDIKKFAAGDDFRTEIQVHMLDFGEENKPEEKNTSHVLDKFGVNLTQMAREGKIDPVVGREQEIERVVQILSRRKKNNPILIGEAGVGKSAIIEGLALRIAGGEVPYTIADKTLFSLDVSSLVAGTKFRGEFEERMQQLLDELRKAKDTIIFIDEIHTIVGAGSTQGSLDTANILKPALARGELQTIGATTLDEYQKYFEQDKALERRFQKVMVDEPTQEDAISILRGLKDRYENHHQVRIKDEAIVAAVELSTRYITSRFLPDKAIDLVDEAASRLRLEMNSVPEEIDTLDRRVRQLEIEREAIRREKDRERVEQLTKEIEELKSRDAEMRAKWQGQRDLLKRIQENKDRIEQLKIEAQQAERQGDYGKVAEIRYGKIQEAEKEIAAFQEEYKLASANGSMIKEEVDAQDVAEVVSRWTGIPVTRMLASEREKLLHMEDELHRRVIGQEQAIAAISDAVRRSRAGLNDPRKPIGSFIFLGTTGVGKTELAKALAEFLFNDDSMMTRIDMSEYQERHSVSRLVGAPPGYVGYDEGGQLTEAVRRKPYSVVLLDEIEKAHPDVFNILLQVLDDGRLTDNKGRTVDFRNTIIIMTSNMGSQVIQENFAEAFNGEKLAPEVVEKTRRDVIDLLKQQLKPEFLNRIDEIVMFEPLTRKDIERIVDIQLGVVRRMLAENGIRLEYSEKAREWIAAAGYDPLYGARPVKRTIQRYVVNDLSKRILAGDVNREQPIRIDADDKGLTFAN